MFSVRCTARRNNVAVEELLGCHSTNSDCAVFWDEMFVALQNLGGQPNVPHERKIRLNAAVRDHTQATGRVLGIPITCSCSSFSLFSHCSRKRSAQNSKGRSIASIFGLTFEPLERRVSRLHLTTSALRTSFGLDFANRSSVILIDAAASSRRSSPNAATSLSGRCSETVATKSNR